MRDITPWHADKRYVQVLVSPDLHRELGAFCRGEESAPALVERALWRVLEESAVVRARREKQIRKGFRDRAEKGEENVDPPVAAEVVAEIQGELADARADLAEAVRLLQRLVDVVKAYPKEEAANISKHAGLLGVDAFIQQALANAAFHATKKED